jgi:hypothetical protein
VDAATIRARLQAEGIAVTAHRDGTFTAGIMKPRRESWVLWLRDRVRQFPGIEVIARIERPAADPYFAHAEIRFTLGTRPESRPRATTSPTRTEVPCEVAIAEGAVTPAQHCVSLGMRPGSCEGPGRLSPGETVAA